MNKKTREDDKARKRPKEERPSPRPAPRADLHQDHSNGPTNERWRPSTNEQVEGQRRNDPQGGGPRTICCYNCLRMGHLSRNCRQPRRQERVGASVNFNTPSRSTGSSGSQSLYVRWRINGQDRLSLLDTGSEVNLLPASVVAGSPTNPTMRELFAANSIPHRRVGRSVDRSAIQW